MVFRAKAYRIFSIGFALCGFVIFVMIYDDIARGNFQALMQRPVEALVLLVPFVPAIILSKMATKNDDKIKAYKEKRRKQRQNSFPKQKKKR